MVNAQWTMGRGKRHDLSIFPLPNLPMMQRSLYTAGAPEAKKLL